MRRIFAELKYRKEWKKDLLAKGLTVNRNSKHRKFRQVLTIWMRALDNEAKMKVL